MAHPVMYDGDDPVLARLREIALSFPGAGEKVTHGWPAFYTVKVFGYFGAASRSTARTCGTTSRCWSSPTRGEYEALAQDPRVYRPAYLGPYGWLGLDLRIDMDWTEVAELLDASYRITAPRRLTAELDARR